MTTPVIYDISIGRHKPHSGKQPQCPFCHKETLTHILDEQDDIVWLMNKYPVFKNTYPTVIIESSVHETDLTEYTAKKMRQVISFGLQKWDLLEKDKRFRSAIYFRNYGPGSGGSQRHPHSQIIGLEEYDYRDNIAGENFLGTVFHEDENCFASLSAYPICGMGELNVTLKTDGHIDTFADTIQKIAQYILRDFPIPCNSYNLFFYHMKHIHVKLFPRYMASPLYMGYRITHVMDKDSSEKMISTLTSAKYFG